MPYLVQSFCSRSWLSPLPEQSLCAFFSSSPSNACLAFTTCLVALRKDFPVLLGLLNPFTTYAHITLAHDLYHTCNCILSICLSHLITKFQESRNFSHLYSITVFSAHCIHAVDACWKENIQNLYHCNILCSTYILPDLSRRHVLPYRLQHMSIWTDFLINDYILTFRSQLKPHLLMKIFSHQSKWMG